jgi:hypothetical protein
MIERPPARDRPSELVETYSTTAAAARIGAAYDRLLSSR